VRVLYVNHTAQMSGAERSLLTLLAGLPKEVSPGVASPEGPLSDAVRRLGVPLHVIPAAEGSLRLHAAQTPAGVLAVVRATQALSRAIREFGAELVHANSIRAGVVSSLATRLSGPPQVVSVRDCLPPGPLSSITIRLIRKRAAAVLPNSRYTGERFMQGRPGARLEVAYSPLDFERFDPAVISREGARGRLALDRAAPVLAVIAQLTPWKGQDDAIRIVARLKPNHPDVRLLLVGSAKFVKRATRYDNQAYRAGLARLTIAAGVEENVVFLGERDDIPEIVKAIDILLVPSWEEPFGRAIVEAMAMERPVVATNVGGPSEIIRSGEDGVLLPPQDPERWTEAIETLIARPELRAMMGRTGRERASRFSVESHVEAVVSIYAEALARNGP
jgi:glycosyltransferase involved in cell wall biosynthesis